MAQFEPLKPEIQSAGVQVAFVAAEKRDGIWKPGKFLEKHPISFPFLLDEDRVATRLYGLHHAFGADALNIAHPATFVIDREGTVRFIYRGDNQNDRAPLETVLQAAKEIC
jgi:peroxiredoxin